MNEEAHSEFCSTPRCAPQDPAEAFVSADTHDPGNISPISPSGSDESEADVIERNIRLSGNCNTNIEDSSENAVQCQQLTNEIEPTTMITGSIMHTVESPSQLKSLPPIQFLFQDSVPKQSGPPPQVHAASSYFPADSTSSPTFLPTFPADSTSSPTFLPTFEVPFGQATSVLPPTPPEQVQPSAPTLLDIQTQPTIPLMDVSKFQNPELGSPKQPGHLGQRPAIPLISDSSHQPSESNVDELQSPVSPNVSIPQEQMNLSLSPITSPQRLHLLKPSIHWYFSNPDGSWTPFSYRDSANIEDVYNARSNGSEQVSISTDGGRYDVNLAARQRIPVYWEGIASAIRRCSWFYRGNHDIMQPYNEDKAKILEEHYCTAVKLRTFPMRVELGDKESVIINSDTMLVQYSQRKNDSDSSEQSAPRLVKRGVPDEDKIPPDEKDEIDHLVFVLHGIGSVGDLKFRSFVDCVSDMRGTCQELIAAQWNKIVKEDTTPGRIEFLPIQWHAALHSDTLGVDRHISKLTLPSIPLLRDFVNSTCVDVLFYTSPYYCETIVDQCVCEMNRLYKKFIERNPTNKGKISIAGHSLGSVIAFDILSQQQGDDADESEKQDSSLRTMDTTSTECLLKEKAETSTTTSEESQPVTSHISQTDPGVTSQTDISRSDAGVMSQQLQDSVTSLPNRRLASRSASYTRSVSYHKSQNSAPEFSGTGQPLVQTAALSFHPQHLFAMGSPLGLFLAVRGVHNLSPSFSLPTCKRFFNIFHPYDPVAYKLEPLIIGKRSQPLILPHHKGRKRMHKEITDQIARVGVAVKNQISSRLFSFYNSSSASKEPEELHEEESAVEKPNYGALNKGGRVDYVLQESPLEIVNEYLFSLSSHLCYWSSEDTILLMVREICRTETSTPSHLPLV